MAEGGPAELRRECTRLLVRGEVWAGSGGGSAGPLSVKEIRRGRVEVVDDFGVAAAVGFSGAAMTGVAGVAEVERLVGLAGDGAGAASGTVVVTVLVTIFRGSGWACSVLRFLGDLTVEGTFSEDGLAGEVTISICLGGGSGLGESSRFRFFAGVLVVFSGFSSETVFFFGASLALSILALRAELSIGFSGGEANMFLRESRR